MRYIVSYQEGHLPSKEVNDIEADDHDEAMEIGLSKLGRPLMKTDSPNITIRVMLEDEPQDEEETP